MTQVSSKHNAFILDCLGHRLHWYLQAPGYSDSMFENTFASLQHDMHIRKKTSWNLNSSHDRFNDRCFVSSTITSLHVACIFALIHHRTFLVIGLGTKTTLQEFDALHGNAEFHELCHHLSQLEVWLCVTHLSPVRCPFGRELFRDGFLIPKNTLGLVIVAFFRLPSIFIEALKHDS